MDLTPRENQDIRNMVYTIRGQQVMLDSDLAKLYGYTVKRLNEQVKRNINRFPEDFMFQLTYNEMMELSRSQFATTIQTAGVKGGRVYCPFAFTEQGVYMLAAVLKGELAEQQSIYIMRAFREMKKIIASNMYVLPPSVYYDIESLKERQNQTDSKLDQIVEYMSNSSVDRQKVFYDGQTFDAMFYISNLIRSAEKSIVLIDGYTDDKTLNILSKKKNCVTVDIYSFKYHQPVKTDIEAFNVQYQNLTIKTMKSCHDRYLIIDDVVVYNIGASLKDAGKKAFSISRIEDMQTMREIVERLEKESKGEFSRR